MSTWWNHVTYFNPQVDTMLACSHCGRMELVKESVLRLDALRARVGRPFTINSGYRCPDHAVEKEKRQPGFHTWGRAFDIHADGRMAYEIVRHAPAFGFTGILINVKLGLQYGFVHLDDITPEESATRPICKSYP